jgi:dynein assembly factor 1
MSLEKKKPVPERNEKGSYYITEKYCKELCEYNGYYSTPHLNYNLFLHFKGFSKIENLESFINVRVLYLENNCLHKIENISHMKNLSCL